MIVRFFLVLPTILPKPPLSLLSGPVGVEAGRALLRSGARPGDLVVVSGRPGAAAHALSALASGAEANATDRAALDYPVPRLELGRALQGLATACIDLSDGLLADLGHVLVASGLGAELELDRLPIPPSMVNLQPFQLGEETEQVFCNSACISFIISRG